jgi:hypothetical protein
MESPWSRGQAYPAKRAGVTLLLALATLSLPAVAQESEPEPAPNATVREAFDFYREKMNGSPKESGVRRFTWWSARNLTWEDAAPVRNETAHNLALKDPRGALGKRLCVTGRIGDLHARYYGKGKDYLTTFIGWIVASDGKAYGFTGVRASDPLVTNDTGRFCGFVVGTSTVRTGKRSQRTQVDLVGMFDVPLNRKPSR